MQVYCDRDTDPELIKSKRVVVLGFGRQGHAHALNLRDSGVAEIAIAGRPGVSLDRAKVAGFHTVSNAEAAVWADVIVMAAPDEYQPDIYIEEIGERLCAMMPWLSEKGLGKQGN